MEALDELLRVYDTLWLNLVNVSTQHGLECSTKSLIRELELSKDRFHFFYGDSTATLRVRIYQRLMQLHFFQVHFSDVQLVQEYSILNLPCLCLIELFGYYFELSG